MSEKGDIINDDVASVEISMSEIEAIANANKIIPKENINWTEEIQEEDVASNHTNNSVHSIKSIKSVRSTSSSTHSRRRSSERSSRSDDTDYAVRVKKENKNIKILREKTFLIFQIKKTNPNGIYGDLIMTTNDLLDDIKTEYNRIIHEKKISHNVNMMKGILTLGVKGIELLNEKFNPIGMDLEGWSESMEYSLGQHQYDEVLTELSEKYKSVGTVSPELKLCFMIFGSAIAFSVTKNLFKQTENPLADFPQQKQQKQRQQINVQQTNVQQTNEQQTNDKRFQQAQPQGSYKQRAPTERQGPQLIPRQQVDQSKLDDPESIFDEDDLKTIMMKMNANKQASGSVVGNDENNLFTNNSIPRCDTNSNSSESQSIISIGSTKSRKPPYMR